MTSLLAALTATPRRLLLVMGRQRGLSFSSSLPKTALLARLAHTLAAPAFPDRLGTIECPAAGSANCPQRTANRPPPLPPLSGRQRRLDRIQTITLVSRPDEEGQPWT